MYIKIKIIGILYVISYNFYISLPVKHKTFAINKLIWYD